MPMRFRPTSLVRIKSSQALHSRASMVCSQSSWVLAPYAYTSSTPEILLGIEGRQCQNTQTWRTPQYERKLPPATQWASRLGPELTRDRLGTTTTVPNKLHVMVYQESGVQSNKWNADTSVREQAWKQRLGSRGGLVRMLHFVLPRVLQPASGF